MRLSDEQIARVKALEDTHGRIAPSRVLNDARRKDSPLHGLFDWNQARAARAHWLDRAREIIGAVKVVVTTTTATVKAPFYVRDPDAKQEGYRSVTALRGEPASARESLIYTLEVASGHLRRAYDLAEPLGLSGEVDQLLAQVAGVQRAIREAA